MLREPGIAVIVAAYVTRARVSQWQNVSRQRCSCLLCHYWHNVCKWHAPASEPIATRKPTN